MMMTTGWVFAEAQQSEMCLLNQMMRLKTHYTKYDIWHLRKCISSSQVSLALSCPSILKQAVLEVFDLPLISL